MVAQIPLGNHKCPVSKHAFSKPWPLSLKGPSSAVSVSYLAFSVNTDAKEHLSYSHCFVPSPGLVARERYLYIVFESMGPFLQRLVLKLAIREMLFSSGPQVVQPTFVFSFCDEIRTWRLWEKFCTKYTYSPHTCWTVLYFLTWP